jgi:hypothetical protein
MRLLRSYQLAPIPSLHLMDGRSTRWQSTHIGVLCQKFKEAVAFGCNRLTKDGTKTYLMLLCFPCGTAFTNAVFNSKTASYGLIKPQVVPKLIPVHYGTEANPMETKNLEGSLLWVVTSVEEKPCQADVAMDDEGEDPAIAEITAATCGMDLAADGDGDDGF